MSIKHRTAPRTTHRAIATTAALAALSIVLAACSGGGEGDGGNGESTTAEGGSGEAVTITYSNFTANGGNEENLATIVDAFEEANPDVTVEVTTLPYADYFTALQTDLAGGTQADVFDIEYATFGTYAASDVFAPIEGVDTAVYTPSLLEAYQADGKQLALPISFSTVVLFYNAAMFDAAGLEYPDATWTWEDEKAAAEKLTDAAAGTWGDYQPISYNEFYKVLAQAGGEFLSEDGTTVAFNSPEGTAAAEWLVNKSGTVMPTVEQGAGTPDFDSGLFADGKLAMWHTGVWMFGGLADAPFAWDIAVEPGQETQASAMFSNAVAISKESEHQEAATAFAEFLSASDVTVQTRLDAGWELPPIADEAALAPYLDKDAPANRQAVFDSLDAVALAPSIGANQTRMQDVLTEKLTEAAAGRLTVAEALEQAEAEINKLLG